MGQVKISVIVPVYNTELYLKRCLNSLVNQTLEEMEIICINDSSPDNSIKILRQYEKQYPNKVRVIDSKVNLRQGGARNLGIKESRGKYIGFIDSDDWARLDMYEMLFQNSHDTEDEIVYCDYQIAKSEEGPFKPVYRNTCIKWNESIEDVKKSLIIKPYSIWSGIYSRNLFFENNIFFPENLFYEDNYIVPLLVTEAKRITKVSQTLVYYFTGNVSITRSFNNNNFFDRVTVSKMMLDEHRKRPLSKYDEEFEFFFIETFFINTSIGCLRKFFPIKFKEVLRLREEISFFIPQYKENKYLKEKMKEKIHYRGYVLLLIYMPYILYLCFLPFSIYKWLRTRRIRTRKKNT